MNIFCQFLSFGITVIFFHVSSSSGLLCYCDDCGNKSCWSSGYCFASTTLDLSTGEIQHHQRCYNKDSQIPIIKAGALLCNETHSHFVSKCCNDDDYCNKLSILPKIGPEGHTWSGKTAVVVGTCIVFMFIVIVVSFVICFSCKWNNKMTSRYQNPETAEALDQQPILGASTFHGFEMTTSGSGSGLPMLTQRSIAREIQLVNTVGNGRFGEVWLGKWGNENVAVKIFSTRDERSWSREAEIYHTTMLRHDNILGFIGADNKDSGTWTQLWLITVYHEKGSLFDFLSENTVDVLDMIKMSFSIAMGLNYLHIEIFGTQGSCFSGKPAIAHRDLKSKNILVKNDGTCAIGDLGLAVRYCSFDNIIDLPCKDSWVGTKRYMAPEILEGKLNITYFESFKKADIYAFGLVLWEIARRCNVFGECDEYQLPFYDLVPSDPTIEDMKKVVCVQGKRPTIPNRWASEYALSGMTNIMTECWYYKADSRLTASRIKKKLLELEKCIKNPICI